MIPWAHPSPQPKRHLDQFSHVFAEMTAGCPYTLQWKAPSLSKLPLSMWGSGPPSNTWFPAPSWVLNPNGISISSAVFAGLTSVTNRQTDRDHATRLVTIYVALQCDLIITAGHQDNWQLHTQPQVSAATSHMSKKKTSSTCSATYSKIQQNLTVSDVSWPQAYVVAIIVIFIHNLMCHTTTTTTSV